MSKFIQGNVIKTKDNSIEIVTEVDEQKGLTMTIPINASNCSCIHRDRTHQREDWCDCGMVNCEYCYERKPRLITVYGANEAVFLANNIKEWITKSLTKKFDF